MLSEKELKAIKLRKFRCHEKIVDSRFELYDDLVQTLVIDDIRALIAEVERLREGIKVCADNRCPPDKEVMKYCEPGKCAMCWNKWTSGGE